MRGHFNFRFLSAFKEVYKTASLSPHVMLADRVSAKTTPARISKPPSHDLSVGLNFIDGIYISNHDSVG
jgi:hypothetical protein